jgi:hypothetical protein
MMPSLLGVYTDILEDLEDKTKDCAGEHFVLVFDEMKIKNELVYQKHSGQIIGYVNLGSVENQLMQLEDDMYGNSQCQVATHVLQFMVRGLTMKLNYPVAHFATANLTAEQLHPIVWGVIADLECIGLKIIIVTADGAAANRKFFRLHKDPSGYNEANGVVYKARNIYAPEREVYFVSDVPHLIKTVQNCWERSHFGGPRLMLVRIILMMMVHATCYFVITHFYIHNLYRKMDSIFYGSSWKTSRRGPMPHQVFILERSSQESTLS